MCIYKQCSRPRYTQGASGQQQTETAAACPALARGEWSCISVWSVLQHPSRPQWRADKDHTITTHKQEGYTALLGLHRCQRDTKGSSSGSNNNHRQTCQLSGANGGRCLPPHQQLLPTPFDSLSDVAARCVKARAAATMQGGL